MDDSFLAFDLALAHYDHVLAGGYPAWSIQEDILGSRLPLKTVRAASLNRRF
jgi:hypothetical protein